MSKTILADVDGWTPLIDALIQKYGLVTAAVFGRVWRYCQGKRETCDASIETIAEELGVNYRTILRHIKTLAADGYLKDTTPDLRNRPHIYADTGKANFKIRISALTESQSTLTLDHTTMTLDQSHSDSESHEETRKRQEKKQVKRDSGASAQPSASTPEFPSSGEKQPAKNGDHPKKKRLSSADPRTSHPAIQAIFGITGRFPRLEEYDGLITALGDAPDKGRLESCWAEWRRAGPGKKAFSPTNYGWAVDWYRNGIPNRGDAPPAPNDFMARLAADQANARERVRLAKERTAARLLKEKEREQHA